MTPPVKSGPRYNNLITAEKVRVIDDDGENLGVLYTREAIAQAAEVGLDLVEVSPNADPPVCKFLDIGKFKYEAQKKANLARKSQKTQEIKEIKMRPNIDDHDYMVKMKKVAEFIEEGDKVKITLRFRGRECTCCNVFRPIRPRPQRLRRIPAWKAVKCLWCCRPNRAQSPDGLANQLCADDHHPQLNDDIKSFG